MKEKVSKLKKEPVPAKRSAKTTTKTPPLITVEECLEEVSRIIESRTKSKFENDCILLGALENEIIVGKTIGLMVKRINNASVFQPYERIEEERHCVLICLSVITDKKNDKKPSQFHTKLQNIGGVKFISIRKLSDLETFKTFLKMVK